MKPPNPSERMPLSAEFQPLCNALLYGILSTLGDKLFGLYLYGALAFPESDLIGDIDFHAVLSAPLTEAERAAILQLQTELERDYPPLGGELDGYYLLFQNAHQALSPADQRVAGLADNSWALNCAHIRAGRCITLHGPDPANIYPVPSWRDLEQALLAELDYVESNLERYPAYCILNLCRIIYSYEAKDVVISKVGAASWAWERFPDWRPAIEAARRSYAGKAAEQDETRMWSVLPELLSLVHQISSPPA